MQHYARSTGIVQRLSILGQALRQEWVIVVREIWRIKIVPSVMVLALGGDVSLSVVVDAVVAGAKRVRFTEVATRAADADVFRYRRLDADAELSSYDGVIVVASDDNMTATTLPPALRRLVEHASGT